MRRITDLFRKLLKDTAGAALVEFGVLLPSMILFFAVTVEGGRIFWGYQAAISGVRDATRYLARVAPSDICHTGGSVAIYQPILSDIVGGFEASAVPLFPARVEVIAVIPSVQCVAGSFRGGPIGVASVSASVQFEFPFSRMLALFGDGSPMRTAVIRDQSRIYGS